MTSETEIDRLHRLLNTLSMAPRAVFLLHRIDALDFHQIAWRLGIGLDEVERHLLDAILRLFEDEPG